MGEIADRILLGDLHEETKKPEKEDREAILDAILGPEPTKDDVVRSMQPTGEYQDVRLRHGESPPKMRMKSLAFGEKASLNTDPVKEYVDTGQKDTGFLTHVKAGFVDKPETKIKIYAKARGMPADRYRVIDGEIVYKADDGKWYRESKQTGGARLKRVAGEMVPQVPTGVMAGIGAASGPMAPILAPVGAMGGEGIRKTVGNLVFKEPQTTKGNLKSMGIEGAFSLPGTGAGKAATRLINRAGRKRGGKLVAAAGRSAKDIDVKKVAELEKVGKEVGVDLLPPQTTGSKRLADKFNLLGDLDASSDIIQGARKKQMEQINDSIYKFLDKITPAETSRIASGTKLKNAAGQIIEGSIAGRTKAVSPIYKRAFKEAKPVDVSPVVAQIDKLKESSGVGSKADKALSKIKKLLAKRGGEDGELINRLEVVDNVKKEIDTILKGPDLEGADKDVIYKISRIKDTLTTQADKSTPLYKQARDQFGKLSPAVDKQRSSKVGELAGLKKDNTLEGAAKKLFSNVGNSPEAVKYAKAQIAKVDPKAWDEALKTHIQDLFEKTKLSAGGVDVATNIGGNFFKRTWGDPQQRKILEAAMSPDQFEYFAKLSQVMERAGMILRKESATATRQEMMNEIGGKLSRKVVRSATMPLYTWKRILGEKFTEASLGANSKKLAEAMVSEKAAKQLKKLYKLSPKSEKFIPAFSAFLSVLGGAELKRSYDRSRMPDTLQRARGTQGRLQDKRRRIQ